MLINRNMMNLVRKWCNDGQIIVVDGLDQLRFFKKEIPTYHSTAPLNVEKMGVNCTKPVQRHCDGN